VIDTGEKKQSLRVVPAIDGVGEPILAPILAEIILAGSAGAPPGEKLVRQLSDAKADVKYRFRESDDQTVPPLILVITGLATLLLAVVVPLLVAAPFRAPAGIGADTFLIYPRLASVDPRALVAAIGGAALLCRGAMRLAAGPDLMVWARGAAAGWNSGPRFIVRAMRIVAARIVLHTPLYAIALCVALVLFLPTARERVLVDGDGVHIRAGLPFFDRDVPWANVDQPELIDHGGGVYDIVLRTVGGGIGSTIVDTRGMLFYGLSPYALGQFAERERNAP
jgi:hypothetical protein